MTTPHPEEPAEGADDESTETQDSTPSSPDKTGDRIDSGKGPGEESAG